MTSPWFALLLLLGATSLSLASSEQPVSSSNNSTTGAPGTDPPSTCVSNKHVFDPYRHKKKYHVGIHAIRGFEAAMAEYNMTFTDYLTKTAGQMFDPPIEFELVPYLFDGLFEAIYKEEVDFFYANPGIYSCVATEVGASGLATIVSNLEVRGESFELDVFAGVIMARKDNKKVNSVQDLKDKIIAAGSTSMIMAGQMQFYEMQKAGLSYVNDPKQVVLTHNQFDVVNGVLEGKYDVGFVRTDTIERTRDKDGKFVDPEIFKVLEPKIYVMDDGNMFPFLHSTDILPEWPVTAVNTVPKDVALEVQQALLALKKHASVGEKLEECRTTSSISNCQAMAQKVLEECSQSSLNITVCQIMVDQKLHECKSNLHRNDCETMPFPYAFDDEARCDTTKPVAELANTASKVGKFAGFRPSLGYFEVRSMQQEAGFMKQNEDGDWYCPRPSSLYEGIDCPRGYYKRSFEEFTEGCTRQDLECGEGYDCFCKPCVNAFEVDVYPFQEGDIDYHIEMFHGYSTEGCEKMSICAAVPQGQTITMRAYDNLEREGVTVTVLAHAGDSVKELEVTRVEGTFAYEFDITDHIVRVQVVEVFVDGMQIPQSPIRVTIEPLNCDEVYGVNSNRKANKEGECVCANNTYEISGACIESQFFFLMIFSLVIAVVAILVFVYVTYKRNQNDSVWHINVDELHFNEPPEVIGQGGFGVVILGQYRGTKVAVKRVIPPGNMWHSKRDSNHATESVEDPLHPGEAKQTNSKKPSAPNKKNSSEGPKEDSADSKTLEKPESNSKKGVNFKAVNMAGDVEAPPQKGRHRDSVTMSANDSWEELLRPQKYNSVLKILESATLSSHGSCEANESIHGSSSWFTRCVPDFLRFDQHSRVRREFVNEMRLLSRLRHPCITTVMGAVVASNVDPMLVMEYMEYGSLYDLLHNETMSAGGEIILQIARDIVQGLQFLHASKPPILHGDLKAKNILVDSRFRAKVSDFGFAQVQKRDKSNISNILHGTPFYMAPEYLTRRSEFNEACDIYSLSMIFYEIYARKDPFEGEDPRKVLPKICHPRVNRRPTVPEACPAKMADIMKKCWAANPFFRPSAKDIDYILVEMTAAEAEPIENNKNVFKDGIKRKPTSLYDVFPKHIADALNAGQRVEAESHEIVTVVFSDIVGFTDISQTFTPLKVSDMLDRLYQAFDELARKHCVFKVETIGDAYMGVTNLDGTQFDTHVKNAAEFAMGLVDAASQILIDQDDPERGTVQIRVGFHSGPVVSNVIGSLNPRYGLFGDTVNTASRMESNSAAGHVLCTYTSARLMETQAPHLEATIRGKIAVKGKGKMITYWVGRKDGDNKNLPTLEAMPSFSESPTDAEDQHDEPRGEGSGERATTEAETFIAHDHDSFGTHDTDIMCDSPSHDDSYGVTEVV